MRRPSAIFFSVSPAALWHWGRIVLVGSLVFSLAVVMLMAWKAPELLPFIPLLLLGGFGVHFLIRRPLLHLCVITAGFVALLPQVAGFQWYEVVYGLYTFGYLGAWFGHHLLLCRDKILVTPLDKIIFIFLVYATATFALTFLFGGDAPKAFAEWTALTFLAFYFPLKEIVRQRPEAMKMLLLAFGLLALFVVFRNFYAYYHDMLSAERLYQILRNRERANERLLMMAMFGTLMFFLYTRKRVHKIVLLGFLVLYLGGVVVSLSRMIWLASVIGFGLLFLLAGRHNRIQMTLLAGVGAIVLALFGMLVLDDFFFLVLSGLGDRVSSIGSAASQDLSLINRFYEWRTAWKSIVETPILGHGFGVPYEYYSLQYRVTEVKYFVHNMYLGIWYRHGIIGLGLVLVIFSRVLWDGYRLVRSEVNISGLQRAAILTCMASVLGFAFAGLTEPLFLVDDGIFSLAYPIALISGIWQSQLTSADRA